MGYVGDAEKDLCIQRAFCIMRNRKYCNNYPRYLGQYGNCLIALRNQRITDKLYLITGDTFGKIKKNFWQLDMYLAEEFLNRYADRIIER